MKERNKQTKKQGNKVRNKDGHQTGGKYKITWCFMPSQPLRLYEGDQTGREKKETKKQNKKQRRAATESTQPGRIFALTGIRPLVLSQYHGLVPSMVPSGYSQ